MLRSELRPGARSILPLPIWVLGWGLKRYRIPTLMIMTVTVVFIGMIAEHVRADDKRAERLRSLERERAHDLADPASGPMWSPPITGTTTNVDLNVILDAKASETFCSHPLCRYAKPGSCYAAWISDQNIAVNFKLPCVDGHVGMWEFTSITKLP